VARTPTRGRQRNERRSPDAFSRLFESAQEGVYIGTLTTRGSKTAAANPHLRLMFGYAVDTALMPTACPSCGAARYSFEKEIALSKAWEIAGAGARKSSDLFRTLAGKASGPSKPLLEALAREEDGTAAQADLHVAELRT